VKPASAQTPVHPRLETLALYATGDLPWRLRWRTASHTKRCAECEQQVLLLRSARVQLKREADAQTLTGFEAIADWGCLEREMLGNIAVGVSAARCIDKVGRKRGLLSKTAFVAVLMVMFVAGWVTHIPYVQTLHLTASLRRLVGMERPQPVGPILQTTPDGIAVRTQGATLTILHPRSAVVSMSGASAVGARYFDEETGQVTITNVYAQ
jgi:hypothetical protein